MDTEKSFASLRLAEAARVVREVTERHATLLKELDDLRVPIQSKSERRYHQNQKQEGVDQDMLPCLIFESEEDKKEIPEFLRHLIIRATNQTNSSFSSVRNKNSWKSLRIAIIFRPELLDKDGNALRQPVHFKVRICGATANGSEICSAQDIRVNFYAHINTLSDKASIQQSENEAFQYLLAAGENFIETQRQIARSQKLEAQRRTYNIAFAKNFPHFATGHYVIPGKITLASSGTYFTRQTVEYGQHRIEIGCYIVQVDKDQGKQRIFFSYPVSATEPESLATSLTLTPEFNEPIDITALGYLEKIIFHTIPRQNSMIVPGMDVEYSQMAFLNRIQEYYAELTNICLSVNFGKNEPGQLDIIDPGKALDLKDCLSTPARFHEQLIAIVQRYLLDIHHFDRMQFGKWLLTGKPDQVTEALFVLMNKMLQKTVEGIAQNRPANILLEWKACMQYCTSNQLEWLLTNVLNVDQLTSLAASYHKERQHQEQNLLDQAQRKQKEITELKEKEGWQVKNSINNAILSYGQHLSTEEIAQIMNQVLRELPEARQNQRFPRSIQ